MMAGYVALPLGTLRLQRGLGGGARWQGCCVAVVCPLWNPPCMRLVGEGAVACHVIYNSHTVAVKQPVCPCQSGLPFVT